MKQLFKVNQNKYLTIFLVALVILSTEISFDTMAVTIEEAKNQGSSIGSGFTDSFYISNNIITEKTKQETPGYTTDNPEETKYFNNPSALNSNSPEVTKAKTATVGGQFMTETLQDPNRPIIPVSLNDPYLSKAKPEYVKLSPEYQEVLKMFTTNYSDCKPVTITSSEFETRTCDDFDEMTGGVCEVPQEVHVKAEHNYNCLRSRQTEGRICDRSLSIVCEDNNGQCDAGGINLTSIASDMVWNYHYPILTIGSIGDDYWRQWGGDSDIETRDRWGRVSYSRCSYHRSISFDVRNVNDVTLFNLRSVSYDDQMEVKINGSRIFIGPNSSLQGCAEYGRTWTSDPNVNLIPYLRDGINTIEMEVRVGGGGEAWIKIEARQRCCNNPREVWTEVCK